MGADCFLTEREIEVLRLVSEGLDTAEIADGRVNADNTFRFSVSTQIQGLTREAVFEGTIAL